MGKLILDLEEISRILEGHIIGSSDTRVRGLSFDSRNCSKGSIFAALRGERSDGHDWATAAIENGAAAVLVEREVSIPEKGAMLVVRSVESAVRTLGMFARESYGGEVVGIVGSTGKTTTKDFTASLLGEIGSVSATPGNRNNLLGLPETMMSADFDADFWVLELGISKPNEMEKLAPIARPNTVIFTNIRPVHTEFFGSLEGIAGEKANVLKYMGKMPSVVLNGDDELLSGLDIPPGANRITYGFNAGNDFIVRQHGTASGMGVPFTLRTGNRTAQGVLSVPGNYNLQNFAAAAATAVSRGLTIERAVEKAGQLATSPHRSKLIELDNNVLLVDDSYNSNPSAMAAVLKDTSTWNRRVVAAAGEMLELGKESEEMHSLTGKACAESGVAALLAVGGPVTSYLAEEFSTSGKPCLRVDRWEQGAEWLNERINPGDCVLVKGSRGIGLDGLVAWLVDRRKVN